MDSSTIIKLLAHHFKDNGRTLVRLSGVNRLWRTLLRRNPDGALFLFCKQAFNRLPPTNNFVDENYIECFFYGALVSKYAQGASVMVLALMLSFAKDSDEREWIQNSVRFVPMNDGGYDIIFAHVDYLTDGIRVAKSLAFLVPDVQAQFKRWLWQSQPCDPYFDIISTSRKKLKV